MGSWPPATFPRSLLVSSGLPAGFGGRLANSSGVKVLRYSGSFHARAISMAIFPSTQFRNWRAASHVLRAHGRIIVLSCHRLSTHWRRAVRFVGPVCLSAASGARIDRGIRREIACSNIKLYSLYSYLNIFKISQRCVGGGQIQLMFLARAQFFNFLPKTCEGPQGSHTMLSIRMPILDE